MTAPSSCRAKQLTATIVEHAEWRILAGVDRARIVEFMSAHDGALGTQGTVGHQLGVTIAEMQLPLRETGRMAKQAKHLVPCA